MRNWLAQSLSKSDARSMNETDPSDWDEKITSLTSSELPLLLVSLERFHSRYFCCLL